MKINYKINPKKRLGYLMALAMVFSFTGNSVAQCTLSLSDTTDVSCNGENDGSITVQGTGTTGFYHYVLQVFDATFNVWQQIAQSPSAGTYIATPPIFPMLFADSFRVIMDSGALGEPPNKS